MELECGKVRGWVFDVERRNGTPCCARVCRHPMHVERAALPRCQPLLPASLLPTEKGSEEGWLTLERPKSWSPRVAPFHCSGNTGRATLSRFPQLKKSGIAYPPRSGGEASSWYLVKENP